MPRTQVLSNRVAFDCIMQMVVQWCADMCASVGDAKGIGGIEYGNAVTGFVGNEPYQIAAWIAPSPKQWVAVGTEGDPPSVPVEPGKAVIEAETIEGKLATSGLIQITDAMQIARDEINKCVAEYTLKLFPQRAGTYRKFSHWKRAKARAKVYYEECCGKLKANCYRQNKKVRGVQIISTRRKGLKPGTTFKFAGKWAYYAGRGRPALPRNEWIKRRLARKKAAKKTNITHKDKLPPEKLKVPETKKPRPFRQLKLARKPRVEDTRNHREESQAEIIELAIDKFIEGLVDGIKEGFENEQSEPPE